MLVGCALNPPQQSAELAQPLAAPVVVDAAPVRCSPADTTEFKKTTPRPAPDVVTPAGDQALSKEATRAWIDRLEGSERSKNAAGLRTARDLESCRGKVNSLPAVASK